MSIASKARQILTNTVLGPAHPVASSVTPASFVSLTSLDVA
jgi:hypothetical protein